MLPMVITQIEDVDNRRFMEELYETSRRLMYHIAGKWADSPEEQKDIVQEALARLLTKLELLRGLDRPRQLSYVAHTVRNTAITYLGHKTKEKRLLTDVDPDGPAAPSAPSSEEILLQGEWREEFRQLWAGLPERERLLLEGRYIFHETDEELAKRLGCQPSSVRMALTRARRTLVKELERRQRDGAAGTITGAV